MWGEKDMMYNEFITETVLRPDILALYRIPNLTGFPLFFWIMYRSVFAPIILFFLLFAIGFIGSKFKVFHIPAVLAVIGIVAIPYFIWLNPGSIMMMNLALAFVMTMTIFILNFVKLSLLDYAILFSWFAYITRFSTLNTPYFGVSVPALMVFAAIGTIYKIRLNQLRGKLFYCWFACVLTFIKGYLLSSLFGRYVVRLGQARDSRIEALLIWGIAIVITIAVSAALIYVIKRLFKNYFDDINRMGKAYPQIERFFIYNSLAILILLGAFHFGYGMVTYFWPPNPILEITDLILLFAMLLQLSFLIMVFRITWLKDNLKNKALENQSLAAYSSSLEKNMSDIKHIKHDLKNIFLTMGNFVEQSGVKEMQEFYRNKISPFASNEIAKSDLYSKLANIDNEQLKAFLFYKISQALERGVNVELDVVLPPLEVSEEKNMEFIDLVRILGILLDNAIEECMELKEGFIGIKISRNSELLSYTIKNTLRDEVRINGIRPGSSTKGKDRGKGLVNVRNIIDKYDFVVLNSYLYEDCFTQNIIIHTNP